ncbi:MAG: hypothetical protein ABR567_04870 [Myxococcales bacterium]|nr:hypothetical protein [Myxococcales bacterium]
MDWERARERLGAELIGARENVAARWRVALREAGALPWSIDGCAAELVLLAGAALADGAAAGTPWRKCGGLLRIDARHQGRGLASELSTLWRCMGNALAEITITVDEERQAREVLGAQMEAALRGASAEVRAALLDEPSEDETLVFGGVRALCWTHPLSDEAAERAA